MMIGPFCTNFPAMTVSTVFYLLLAIITFDFILERILHFLNRRSATKPIPAELAGIYDEEKYARSQAYQREVSWFNSLSATISFILIFLAISLGWFGWLDKQVRPHVPFDLITPLYFFAILFVVSDIIGTPFSWYRHFVIEEKYGFNKMTVKTFWIDKLKGYILTLILGGLLLGVFVYLANATGKNFWIYFWMVIVVFTLFANFFYTSWILPLFNKLKPLDDGELKDAICSYCDKVKFPLKNIFVMDASKRSSKGNAFFSGLGRKKKVVLFDTLVEKHSVEELTAIFAHEVGHYKKHHILYSTLFSIVLTGGLLFLLSRMLFFSELSWALGGVTTAIHLNLLAFGILYSPISHILGIIGNLMSRHNEFEADAWAKNTYGHKPLITALKKMSADHLSNLTPHPAYVFMHYSHPPLLQRVQAMER
jgi:STE24 endopeptidase